MGIMVVLLLLLYSHIKDYLMFPIKSVSIVPLLAFFLLFQNFLPCMVRASSSSVVSSSSSSSSTTLPATTPHAGSYDDGSSNSNTIMPPRSKPIIKNFRNVYGTENVFRCASTDGLGDIHNNCGKANNCSIAMAPTDKFVLQDAGLIVDLRSPKERNDVQAQNWISKQRQYHRPIQIVELNEDYCANTRHSEGDRRRNPKNRNTRFVVRINVLSPQRFMSYIEKNWLSPSSNPIATQKEQNPKQSRFPWLKKAVATTTNRDDRNQLQQVQKQQHQRRMNALMERGLAGLNEAILETGRREICQTLQTITRHLELYPNDQVVFHCVQGKDRTGMIAMLLQSILGMKDEDIIEDYFLSNQMLNGDKEGSAAVKDIEMETTTTTTITTARPQDLTRDGSDGNHDSLSSSPPPTSSPPIKRTKQNLFSGTNRHDMMTTLNFLRQKYGSICPGYLDSIGFDSKWRTRLRAVVQTTLSSDKRPSKL